ncbi:NEL-type E3 ubiquitin ligase domain-containing protein [Bordetella sp. LUAb4]|uniref:NEL-type E3 ubiquitin ligase domain-containing protein n=1 Tax=Bordetella sp. LUAb4 TaxID=2843195 RepID=UPI001E5F49B8|nr:NEL-type E3 ubiquitin ligase domain-containing protein [Bordetella sp. LUAb4]
MDTQSTISGPSSPSLSPISSDDEQEDMASSAYLSRSVADYLGPRDDLKRTCLTQRVISVMATLYVTGNMQRLAEGGDIFDEVENYLNRPPQQYYLGVDVALSLRSFLLEEARSGQAPRESMERALGALPEGFELPHGPGFFLAQLAELEKPASDAQRNFAKDAGRMAVRVGVVLAQAHEREAYETAAQELLDLAAEWQRQPWSDDFAEPWRTISRILRDTPLDLPPSVTLKLEQNRNRIVGLQTCMGSFRLPRDTASFFLDAEVEHVDALLGSGTAARAATAATAASIDAPIKTVITDLTELLNQLNAVLGHSVGLSVDVAPRTATGSSHLEMEIEHWYSQNVDEQSSQWRKYAEREGAQEFAAFLGRLHYCKNAYPEWELDAAVPDALATFVVNESVVDEVLRTVKAQAHNIASRTMVVFLAVNQILDTQRAKQGQYDHCLSELIAIGKAAFHCAQQERQQHEMYVSLNQAGPAASFASALVALRHEIDTEIAAGALAPDAPVDANDVMRRLKRLQDRETASRPGDLLFFLLLEWPPLHETLKRLDPQAYAELELRLQASRPEPVIRLQLHSRWVHSVLTKRNEHAALNELFGNAGLAKR